MAHSALVIGYGSIGKMHVDILNEMDEFNNIYVLSCQTGLTYRTITSMEDIHGLTPDYIVIASPTYQHFPQLKYLTEHFTNRKILVEKPLFDSMAELKSEHNEVYIGYNMRFHPMIKKIKKICKGRQLWNINVFCGSFLPDWRPDRDYRQTSSAKKNSGGGVLLDLSHEIDYVQWLAGPLELNHAVSDKVSNLEIDTDDLLLFAGRTEEGAHVHISLNYFTRKPTRRILIDGDGISIQGDLITNSLSVIEDGEKSKFSWSDLKRNDTYRAQHEAILEDDLNNICTYEEGLDTMRIIENIRAWRN